MHCEKFNATISSQACLARQERNGQPVRPGITGFSSEIPYPACMDCGQGQEIKSSIEMGVDMDRDIKAIKNVYLCKDKLNINTDEAMEPGNAMRIDTETRYCPNHPDRIQTKHTLKTGGFRWSGKCSECEKAQVTKASNARQHNIATGHNPAKIVVSFTDRPELLQWLASRADENERTLEREIIWLLRQAQANEGR